MSFIYSDEDVALIRRAFHGEGWTDPALAGIKRGIKERLLRKQKNACCYCKRSFHGEFLMVIDIEHVLPKSKFKRMMFSPRNMAVACKRCNMFIKKDRLDFLALPVDELPKRKFRKQFYKIIHPSLDNYYANLGIFEYRCNDVMLRKYVVVDGSEKGDFTYNYFKLKSLELRSFDAAQGVAGFVAIEPEFKEQWRAILESMS
ncbi:HNH endonuclease [Chromobacterium piscinae]|uniref:HNH endonuclease n=1 Tax=Chromobacterium piscinae TaxID=686831 RepID=UPI00320B0285